ncbi:regulator of G protein signaling domain-containing protein [Pilobolus umbonatus]|nr:regulator of G protein signaling domain-containing protein [Pilobolus umbonatus]
MMKFTIDGRPFLKDIHDLFAALIVQIQLNTHRYLFRNYYNTFSSEDAIQSLGNLKFSHTLCTPDPNDSTLQQRTTTTTTFNMAREVAKSLCQQFQNCRLMENAVDPHNKVFREKGIWHLTPKGLCVLQDFCVRTEVNVSSLRKHFNHMEAIHLIHLDRNIENDQLILNRSAISVVFKMMMASLPLDGELTSFGSAHSASLSKQSSASSNPSSSSSSTVSSSTSSSQSAPFSMCPTVAGNDSKVYILTNYLLTLSEAHRQRKSSKGIRTVLSSQMCCDWLMDYTTVSSRQEAEVIAFEFLKSGWIEYQDPKNNYQNGTTVIKSSKATLLVVTEKGKAISTESNKNQAANLLIQPKEVSKLRSHTCVPEEKTTLKELLAEEYDIDYLDISTIDSEEKNFETGSLKRSISITSSPSSILTETSAKSGYSVHNSSNSNISNSGSASCNQNGDPKESNSARLNIILENPKLRSPFKDFLRSNFCEENLDFWIDYNTLQRKYRNKSPTLPSHNQKDLLEDAYIIWSTYLASGSPNELNVEHSICQELTKVVNSAVTIIPPYVGQAKQTIVITASSTSQSLRMMIKLLDKANEHICRLMASDSVPKFIKTEKYRKIIDSIERKSVMSSVAQYYTKAFGVGVLMGGAIEVLLIKSNYYQMLAASEAKKQLKELQEEQEDLERLKKIKA